MIRLTAMVYSGDWVGLTVSSIRELIDAMHMLTSEYGILWACAKTIKGEPVGV